MTQAELGARLRVSDQTVARWEKDQSEKDRPADLMLRVLFLGSPLAEPEGNNILRGLIKLLDELQERNEAKEKAVGFEPSILAVATEKSPAMTVEVGKHNDRQDRNGGDDDRSRDRFSGNSHSLTNHAV